MLRHATTTARNSTFINITDGRLELRKHNKTLTAPPRERRRRRPIRSLEAITDGASSDFSVPCPPPVRRGTPARHRRDLAGRCAVSDQPTSVYRYGMLAVHLGLDTQQAEHRAQLAGHDESEPAA